MKILCGNSCIRMFSHVRKLFRRCGNVKCGKYSVNSLRVNPGDEINISFKEILPRNIDHDYHKVFAKSLL